MGSIPSWLTPKTRKMGPSAFVLGTWHQASDLAGWIYTGDGANPENTLHMIKTVAHQRSPRCNAADPNWPQAQSHLVKLATQLKEKEI